MATYPELITLFKNYSDLIQGNDDSRNYAREDLVAEVMERLQQLAYIVQNLHEIDIQYGKKVIITKINDDGEEELYNAMFERDQHLLFVMRLLTESFYYFAFRVRQILKNKVHQFPHLKSFDPTGVRNVRNQLIEHPEGKDSLIFNRTFSWSQDSGMLLKSGRHLWEHDKFVDVGLKVNANEFCENLYSLLEQATIRVAQERANQK
jgi:hypothetical protein